MMKPNFFAGVLTGFIMATLAGGWFAASQNLFAPAASADAADKKDAEPERVYFATTPDGRVTPHYDPAMVQQFTHHTNDYLIWDHYDALDIPVLCLRGAESDLVLRETTAEMLTRGPGARGLAQVVEVPGCGHAPALNVPEHFALVDGFLARAS